MYKPSIKEGLSHELRIPLTGILGMAHLLEKTRLDSKQKEYLNRIVTESKRLLALEAKLYSVLKIQS